MFAPLRMRMEFDLLENGRIQARFICSARGIKDLHCSWYLKILSNCTLLKAFAILRVFSNITSTVNRNSTQTPQTCGKFNTSYSLFNILSSIYSNAVYYLSFERAQDVLSKKIGWTQERNTTFKTLSMGRTLAKQLKQNWDKLKNVGKSFCCWNFRWEWDIFRYRYEAMYPKNWNQDNLELTTIL